MGAVQRMTHKLYLQRNQASTDAYGQPEPADWQTLSTVKGHVWVDSEDTTHRELGSVVAGRYKGMVPLGTDVTERDRVLKVEDRAGNELFGVLYIDAVSRRSTHLGMRFRDHA